uniref:tetratricopeptide repeat protein n=1 Tax=Sphingomonas populi TaxID=2484750 RepID=UPI0031F4567A
MVLLASSACAAAPAFGQASAVEGRVGKLESEMRAVQRKVFPGGGGQYLEPEIKPATPDDTPGSPSGSPLSDLTARVNALESQLSGVTGQIETTQHRTQVLEDAFNAYKRSTDARIKALEDTAASTGGGTGSPAPIMGDADAPPPRAGGKGAGVKPPAARPGKADDVAPPTTDPARQKQLAAIERSQSGDPAEDAYLYGYRLWQAKMYPEAEAQFKLVTATYPKHKRASYAQNLLGRSYLEDGKPSLASLAFYDNYKKWPDGERAPDSLYYLGQSLVRLGKPAADVCKVYRELEDVYGAKLSDAMKADVTRAKAQSKCG